MASGGPHGRIGGNMAGACHGDTQHRSPAALRILAVGRLPAMARRRAGGGDGGSVDAARSPKPRVRHAVTPAVRDARGVSSVSLRALRELRVLDLTRLPT